MRQYHSSGYKRKSNKRRAAALMVGILLLFCVPMDSNRDIYYILTSQMIPLLTYEREYGNPDVEYAADYQVPEWFYEDEGEEPVNDDIVMKTLETESDGKTLQASASKDGKNGTTYTRKQLANPDFLLSKIFVVDSNTSMTGEELNLENLLDTDLTVKDLTSDFMNAPTDTKKDEKEETKKKYKILIYHTHGSESFADSRPGKAEDTIVGVGSYLTKILEEQYGIAVYHDKTAYDMVDGVLDRNKAFENAYDSVSKILQDNPSIEVVIDLHRDGVDEETRLVTEVNGKPTAKIMFLNGVSRSNMNGEIEYLNNPNKITNLAFSFQMYLAGKEDYGDYVRKIYVRSLRFNLHLMPRTTLIEVGAQNNTIEEEKNAMEPLAAILYKVLSKEE